MTRRTEVNSGAIGGGTIAGRDIARAATEGVSRAAADLAPGNRIRINTLRVQAAQGADPRQVSAVVRREIARALGRHRP